MRFNIKWQLLLAVVGFALIAALLSFQQKTIAMCEITVPAVGGQLVEGMVGVPVALNPILFDQNPIDQEIGSLIFSGLLSYDQYGQLVPDLAESWEIADEGKSYLFHLRPDLKWHDGEDLTADDLLFTYQLWQQEAPFIPVLTTQFWQSVSIEKVDEQTVQFKLPKAHAPFIDLLTGGILPEHILGGVSLVELPGHPFNQAPIGTGPFLVDEWIRDGRLTLRPNPYYWRVGIRLEGISFAFYATEDEMVNALTAGEIQAINSVSPKIVSTVADLPYISLFSSVKRSYSQLLFNLSGTGGASRTKQVRQALAYSIDRQQLIDEAIQGQGVLLKGPYLPSSWAFNDGWYTDYTYQPITATQLLDGAGWVLGVDQIRVKDGERLQIRLLYVNVAEEAAVASFLAERWGALGIDVLPIAVPAEQLRAELDAGNFDVALVLVEPPTDPDLYDFWSQIAIVSGQNYAGWNNRQASEALEAGRLLVNQAERIPYYNRFQRLFNQDLPALTLYQPTYSYALSEGVEQLDGVTEQPEIGLIYAPEARYRSLANWFMKYKTVKVVCAE